MVGNHNSMFFSICRRLRGRLDSILVIKAVPADEVDKTTHISAASLQVQSCSSSQVSIVKTYKLNISDSSPIIL